MEYLLCLQTLRESLPSFVNYIFVFFSEFVTYFAIVFPVLIYWCVNKRIGQWMFLNYGGGLTVNQLVKNTACVYRPWILDSRLHIAPEAVRGATGYSFPSGHTTCATVSFESIAVWKRNKKSIVVLSALTILLIAFSRNWLGAHTGKDVVFAIFENSLVVIFNIFLFRFIEVNPNKKSCLIFIAIFLGIIALVYMQCKTYPMDYDLKGNLLADPYKMLTDSYRNIGMIEGFLIGSFLEGKFIRYVIPQTKKQKIFVALLGLISFAVLYKATSVFYNLFGVNPGHFIKYFLLSFYIILVYPALVKLLLKKLK